MRFRFLTSTPLNITRGSGTFNGIVTLARFLRSSGHAVEFVTPTIHLPIYTLERIAFNELLRFKREPADDEVTVGFDMDGYTLAGRARGLHIAFIKGVIADEMRFESGLTRATMRWQARREKLHVDRADMVIAPSHYSAGRIRELYGISKEVRVLPEPIDLEQWHVLFDRNPAPPDPAKFTVLTVCRFYPRKRLNILLGAAHLLRSRISELEVRIVGDGPERGRLHALCRNLGLERSVHWLGNLSSDDLAKEYNRCHVFCLPSAQESFGIVFLEAMASGKPIVAARAASIPEVVKHGVLVNPDDEDALAEGIDRLYRDHALRASLAAAGAEWVKQLDAPQIAAGFAREVFARRGHSNIESAPA